MKRILLSLLLLNILLNFSSAQKVFKVPSEYPNIQAAIDASWDGDIVKVANGEYTGDGNSMIYLYGKRITIKSEHGADSCTIGRLIFSGGEDTTTVIDGFTITDQIPAIEVLINASPKIKNCKIKHCGSNSMPAINVSGAIILSDCQIERSGGSDTKVVSIGEGIIRNCNFTGNYCGSKGDYYGIISKYGDKILLIANCKFIENNGAKGVIFGSNIFIDNCIFRDNRTYKYFACVINGSNIYISNSIFKNNDATFSPGLGAIAGSGLIIENSLFVNNNSYDADDDRYKNTIECSNSKFSHCIFANNTGESVINAGENVNLNNCTFYNNTSYGRYGGPGALQGGTAINCIMFRNKPSEALGATITYSLAGRDYDGIGNIYAQPLFVNPDSLDFRLQQNSPCIDAGDPASPLDPDGTRADMGAIPFNHNVTFAKQIKIQNSSGMEFYPNPTNNKIYINSTNKTIESVSLYSISGKCVCRENEVKDNNYEIGLKELGLPKGIYLLKVQTKSEILSRKIVYQ